MCVQMENGDLAREEKENGKKNGKYTWHSHPKKKERRKHTEGGEEERHLKWMSKSAFSLAIIPSHIVIFHSRLLNGVFRMKNFAWMHWTIWNKGMR